MFKTKVLLCLILRFIKKSNAYLCIYIIKEFVGLFQNHSDRRWHVSKCCHYAILSVFISYNYLLFLFKYVVHIITTARFFFFYFLSSDINVIISKALSCRAARKPLECHVLFNCFIKFNFTVAF